MKKKFTMVELLAVMIIITILVTIGISVANVVFRKAGEARTQATLRRIQLAIEEVKSKYGYYPYTRTSKNTNILDLKGQTGQNETYYHARTPNDYSEAGTRDAEYTIIMLGGTDMIRGKAQRIENNGVITEHTQVLWPGERISDSDKFQDPKYPQDYINDFRNVIGEVRFERNVIYDGVGNLMFCDDWRNPIYYRAPGGKYYGNEYDLYSCGWSYNGQPTVAAGFDATETERPYTVTIYDTWSRTTQIKDLKNPYKTPSNPNGIANTLEILGMNLWNKKLVHFSDRIGGKFLALDCFEYAMGGSEPVFDTVDGTNLGVSH